MMIKAFVYANGVIGFGKRCYAWFKLGFDLSKVRALQLNADAVPLRIDEYYLATAGEPKLPTYDEIMQKIIAKPN